MTATLAALALVASPAAAADFQLTPSRTPCVAGSCAPVVTYDASQLLDAVTLGLDWSYDPTTGTLAAQDTLSCVADVLDGEPCTLTGPVYESPGMHFVGVRITDATGAADTAFQGIEVLPKVQPKPPRVVRCPAIRGGEHCGPGNNRTTSGGGSKVSHAGWPAVSGLLFMVESRGGRHRFTGSAFNDELLGYDGDDTLNGGAGSDILWGDSHPVPQNPVTQRDVLRGGPGKDFLYSSHGSNYLSGGPGNDRIYAHWGHGVIDCGPGRDWVGINHYPVRYTLRHCEKVVQW